MIRGTQRYYNILLCIKLALSLAIFVVFANASAFAKVTVDVYDTHVKEVHIALHQFASAENDINLADEISKIITADLNGTGMIIASLLNDAVSETLLINKDESFSKTDQAMGADFAVTGIIAVEGDKYKLSFDLWHVMRSTKTMSRSFVFQASSRRKAAHTIADAILLHTTGKIGNFNSKILYISTQDKVKKYNAGNKRIAIIDQDGAGARYITEESMVMTPFYSPHMKKVIYVSYDNGAPRIKLMSIEDGQIEDLGDILTEFRNVTVVSPQVSPDGKYMVFSAMNYESAADLYRVNLSNKDVLRLTSGSLNVSPSFSPNGRQIAFSSDRSGKQAIYIMDCDGKNVRRIQVGPGAYQEPAWSPDGKFIAFTKIYHGRFSVGIMTPYGDMEKILSSGYTVESPAWSPGGEEIIFSYQEYGKSKPQLKIVSVSGKDLRTIKTNTPAFDPFWFIPR